MNKDEQEEFEAKALKNALNHFNLPFALVRKYASDRRVKTKFYLVLGENTSVSSPTFNYEEMNAFILGMGMAKEYLK